MTASARVGEVDVGPAPPLAVPGGRDGHVAGRVPVPVPVDGDQGGSSLGRIPATVTSSTMPSFASLAVTVTRTARPTR